MENFAHEFTIDYSDGICYLKYLFFLSNEKEVINGNK